MITQEQVNFLAEVHLDVMRQVHDMSCAACEFTGVPNKDLRMAEVIAECAIEGTTFSEEVFEKDWEEENG